MSQIIKAEDILNFILFALSNGVDCLYPDVPVFSEEVPDELPERCFLIGFTGEVTINQEFDIRYKVSGNFDISYFSPKRGLEMEYEFNQVFSNISLSMKDIRYKDILSLKLDSHKKNVTDNVLHDICKFSTFLYVVDNTPLIKDIDYNQEVL